MQHWVTGQQSKSTRQFWRMKFKQFRFCASFFRKYLCDANRFANQASYALIQMWSLRDPCSGPTFNTTMFYVQSVGSVVEWCKE